MSDLPINITYIPTPLSLSYTRRLNYARGRRGGRETGRKEGEGVGETGRDAVTVARGERTG